jgi:hypothetical protein
LQGWVTGRSHGESEEKNVGTTGGGCGLGASLNAWSSEMRRWRGRGCRGCSIIGTGLAQSVIVSSSPSRVRIIEWKVDSCVHVQDSREAAHRALLCYHHQVVTFPRLDPSSLWRGVAQVWSLGLMRHDQGDLAFKKALTG